MLLLSDFVLSESESKGGCTFEAVYKIVHIFTGDCFVFGILLDNYTVSIQERNSGSSCRIADS